MLRYAAMGLVWVLIGCSQKGEVDLGSLTNASLADAGTGFDAGLASSYYDAGGSYDYYDAGSSYYYDAGSSYYYDAGSTGSYDAGTTEPDAGVVYVAAGKVPDCIKDLPECESVYTLMGPYKTFVEYESAKPEPESDTCACEVDDRFQEKFPGSYRKTKKGDYIVPCRMGFQCGVDESTIAVFKDYEIEPVRGGGGYECKVTGQYREDVKEDYICKENVPCTGKVNYYQTRLESARVCRYYNPAPALPPDKNCAPPAACYPEASETLTCPNGATVASNGWLVSCDTRVYEKGNKIGEKACGEIQKPDEEVIENPMAIQFQGCAGGECGGSCKVQAVRCPDYTPYTRGVFKDPFELSEHSIAVPGTGMCSEAAGAAPGECPAR